MITTSAEVLNTMLEARDYFHLLHWRTTSFSEHKAFGEFYEKWLGLTDDFIETYQGRYERINGDVAISISSNTPDAVKYLRELRVYIQLDAPTIIAPSLDTDLANILADMLGLINHTLYLLTLK